MKKLEEIRKKPLIRHIRILIPDVDFLLRAAEQLVNIVRIATSPEYNDGEWNFLSAVNDLDPDVKKLVENRRTQESE